MAQFSWRDKSKSAGEEKDDASAADSLVKSEDFPFEVQLCKWLAECLEHRGIHVSGASLTELLYKETPAGQKRLINDVEQTNSLEEDISRFVEHLGITHYVSAIELGGLRFRIVAEKEYEKKISADGSASVNTKLYGGLEVSVEHSRSNNSKSSHVQRKMIGRITEKGDQQVVMREDEAVIGCELRPISSLVHNFYLQLAVNEAVQKYIETKTKCKCCFDCT